MEEIEGADRLVVQSPIDTLYTMAVQGRITPDEYHEAVAHVAPAAENDKRCIYCDKRALIGQTCDEHTDRKMVLEAARAHRPVINLAIYHTPVALTAAVIAALERTERVQLARRFAERAKDAPGMNALCQIARDYVRLESRMV